MRVGRPSTQWVSALPLVALLSASSACANDTTRASKRGTKTLVERQLDSETARLKVVELLLGDPDARDRIVDLLLEEKSVREDIVDKLFVDPDLRAKTVRLLLDDPGVQSEFENKLIGRFPFTLGRAAFSESYYQLFNNLESPEATIEMIGGLLGQQNLDFLTTVASCKKANNGHAYCSYTDEGIQRIKSEAQVEAKKNKRPVAEWPYLDVYKLVAHGGGIFVRGYINLYMYLSPREDQDDQFYLEGEGVFYAMQGNEERKLAMGIHRVLSNGPYSITELLSRGYIDVAIGVDATTLFSPEIPKANTYQPPSGDASSSGYAEYRIYIDVIDDQIVSIDKSRGHLIGMIINNRKTPIGCIAFTEPYGPYKAIDFSGRGFIRRPDPERLAEQDALTLASPDSGYDPAKLAAAEEFCRPFHVGNDFQTSGAE